VESKENSRRKRAALPWAQSGKKVVESKEFNSEKPGMDAEQVANLVDTLLAESIDGVDPPPETTVGGAEQQTSDIKAKALETARAEAEKVAEKIGEDVQEMRRQAEEGETAFAEVRRRAEAMEEESKTKTLAYLVKATGQIEAETKKRYEEAGARFEAETRKRYEEAGARFEAETKKRYEEAGARFEAETRKRYEEACSRLYSSIQELINAEQDLEADLRSKRKALIESQYSRLVESMPNVLEIPGTGGSDIESAARPATEVTSDVAKEEEVELATIQLQEKVEELIGRTTRKGTEGIKTGDPSQGMEKLEETLRELGETIHELEGTTIGKPVEPHEEPAGRYEEVEKD
jgi:hypothetical protein